mmetsp:Transcript_103315/g.205345  ORF Transcript_103315/g.205345 Transcript_103315/m.205345 type:complete len:110 (-) Transcript_103315:74-403(-)
MSMDKDKPMLQHETIRRLQKDYLVRIGEPLDKVIPGTGVKPASQIKRLEAQIKQAMDELGKVTEEEMLVQADSSGDSRGKAMADLEKRRGELTDRISSLEKQLLEAELL